MTGLRSLNRYFYRDWMQGAPYPGEFEYLYGPPERWPVSILEGEVTVYGRQSATRDTRPTTRAGLRYAPWTSSRT